MFGESLQYNICLRERFMVSQEAFALSPQV
jgi:hypothetical protein